MMELLSRLGVALGISLVLTVVLMVLYQDDGAQLQPETPSISQASPTTPDGTP